MIIVSTHARIRVEQGRPFQNIREVVAKHSCDSDKLSPRDLLAESFLKCRKGMTERSALACLACPRLINFLPQEQSVLVRCLWCDSDPVDSLMTLASELVTVSPSTSIREAEMRARRHQVRHLIVVEENRLAGVLCRCDLVAGAEPDETIADRANHCPWTIGPKTTLSQAARLMRDKQVGMLPVVAERELLGVITRGDLRRAGVNEHVLAADQCASCKNRSGVLLHPTNSRQKICLDCLDRCLEPVTH